jgi:transposase
MPRNYKPKRPISMSNVQCQRAAIIAFYNAKKPTPNAKQITRFFSRTLKPGYYFVVRTIQRYKATGSLSDRPRSGRPRATTAAEDKLMVALAKRNPTKTLYQLLELLAKKHIYVSEETLVQRLHDGGLKSYIVRPKPLLSADHRSQRFDFAKRNIGLNFSKWVFSDEAWVTVFPMQVTQRIWRSPHDKWDPERFCRPKPKKSSKLMVWVCAGVWGKGPLHIFDEYVNQQNYLQLLKKHLPDVEHRLRRGNSAITHAIYYCCIFFFCCLCFADLSTLSIHP